MTGRLAAKWVDRALKGGPSETAPGRLTDAASREQCVLLELVQGKSNKAVANALGISVRTVETHRKNIRSKLGIDSTAGLTRYALEHGVLQTGIGCRSPQPHP